MNSANWAHHLDSCINVAAQGVRVDAGHDGFDIHHCENVVIRDCELRTGDDCVAGYDARNVVVENCLLNTACNGVRLGVTNLRVRGCHFLGRAAYPHRASGRTQAKYAIRYYALAEDTVREDSSGWLFEDCDFESTGCLIFYHFGDEHSQQKNHQLVDVRFTGCRVHGLTSTSHFVGTPDMPGTISFEGCDLSWEAPNEAFLLVGEGAVVHASDDRFAARGFVEVLQLNSAKGA